MRGWPIVWAGPRSSRVGVAFPRGGCWREGVVVVVVVVVGGRGRGGRWWWWW